MRREKTIGRKMTVGFLLAALIPVFLFAFVSRIRMEDSLEETMKERIYSNLLNSDQCLNMVLDKYETILYDMCTDDTIIETVIKIIREQDDMDVNSSALRRELSHLCNSNPGVEGITIKLNNGDVIFYDSLTSSSTTSVWADEIKVPETKEGNAYQEVTKPIVVNEKETYLFQIGRNLLDYRNIHESLGTVVLSINEEEIQAALESGTNNNTYLLKGDTIISAPDAAQIGTSFRDLKNEEANVYSEKGNEKSGFIIWDEQPLEGHNRAILEQVIFLVIIASASCVIMLLIIMIVIKPYLNIVDELVEAMNELEEGNFDVGVKFPDRMPVEIKRIGNGFNEMAEHIQDLIGQVKSAVVEQKNAEISALEAQIDPHFLYNTLDTINWKAIENEQYEISEMLGALADILRYSVYDSGGLTTIRQALFWVDQYALLQQAKLGRPLRVQKQVPEELMGHKIHKLLLQPFFENALKHGVDSDEEFCLYISMRLLDGQMHIIIEDNGKGISEDILRSLNDESRELRGHVGIANVRKRLKLYYGDAAGVYFESEPQTVTRVHLFIPEQEEKE